MVKAQFDGAWYRATYLGGGPHDVDPWRHYLTQGVLLGYDPAPWFSERAYLEDHPDVAAARMPAFEHYVLTGRHEARLVRPSGAQRPVAPRRGRDPRALAEALFDRRFYLACHPDVVDSGYDAFAHYDAFGWREGRDPAPWFSTGFYLTANPDVRDAEVDPFIHFVSVGRHEGRLPRDPLGRRRSEISSQIDVRELGRSWVSIAPSRLLNPQEAAVDLMRAGLQSCECVRIIIGSDDYIANVGGVQSCVAVDVREAHGDGVASLYIWPTQPLPHLASDRRPSLNMRLDGTYVGAVRDGSFATILELLGAAGARLSETIVVHGLLGHDLDGLVDAAEDPASPVTSIDYWVHDYFAACSCYTLSPYAIGFCGAPSVTSTRCMVCPHGANRAAHLGSFDRLLGFGGLRVLAPSVSAADVFTATVSPAHHVAVSPIGRLDWRGSRPARVAGPIRVAFLGFPAPRKGWNDFLDLVRWTVASGDVEFWHVGSEDQSVPGVHFAQVRQFNGETAAMTATLREVGVDLAFHWPSWPETYAITAHEALAAGARVLTNTRSGNVAALSRDNPEVLVLPDETLDWLVRRGRLVSWLRQVTSMPPRWGTFELAGIYRGARVREVRHAR